MRVEARKSKRASWASGDAVAREFVYEGAAKRYERKLRRRGYLTRILISGVMDIDTLFRRAWQQWKSWKKPVSSPVGSL